MSRTAPRVATIDAHREVADARSAARRLAQARSGELLELLETEGEIRALAESIAEYEELLARLSDDQPFKPGRHRLDFGGIKIDLVLSSKPQLRELVACLKERRDELCGREGARRRSQAAAVSEVLRRVEATADTDEDQPPKNLAATSGWG